MNTYIVFQIDPKSRNINCDAFLLFMRLGGGVKEHCGTNGVLEICKKLIKIFKMSINEKNP